MIDWPSLYSGLYGIGGSLIIVISKLRIPADSKRWPGIVYFERLAYLTAFSLFVSAFVIQVFNSIWHPVIEHPYRNLVVLFFHVAIFGDIIINAELFRDRAIPHIKAFLLGSLGLIIVISFTSVVGVYRERAIGLKDFYFIDPLIGSSVLVCFITLFYLLGKFEKFEQKEVESI